MMGRVSVQVWITLAEPSFMQLWHGGEPLWTHLILAFLCNSQFDILETVYDLNC